MIVNVAASVRQRLLLDAKKRGEDFNRTLVRFAIERFLYRLSQHAARNRFLLKGAMLLITWPEIPFRPSGDLDLLGHGLNDVQTIQSLFEEICQIPEESDGLVFDIQSLDVQAMRQEEKYQGIRATVNAYLGTARILVQVDVGFGDAVYPEARSIDFPCLLEGMPQPKILGYPPETVIAEKLEAMVSLAETTSRVKDHYDIWAISRSITLEKAALVTAVRGTFERRGTPFPADTPVALSEGFVAIQGKAALWTAFVNRSNLQQFATTFDATLSDLRQFLGPVIASLPLPEAAAGTWNPATGWSA